MRDIEAFDDPRDSGKPEKLSQLLEFELPAKERDLDVFSDKIKQLLFIPPLRDHDPDPVPACPIEKLRNHIAYRAREDYLCRRIMF